MTTQHGTSPVPAGGDGPRPAQPWGPADQPARRPPPRRPRWFEVMMWALVLVWYSEAPTVLGAVVFLGGGFVLAILIQAALDAHGERRPPAARPADSTDLLEAVRMEAARHGGGVYLGRDEHGRWRAARAERAVLVLGPPRSGKSSGVIIPALLAHLGPAVSTSTKPDVLAATSPARSRVGRVWHFDPTGTESVATGQALRWSPVTAARSWDGALLMARAMVGGARVGAGTTDQTHWSRRASALLAPLLHAAAMSGKDVGTVVDWVLCHELDDPGVILRRADARIGCGVLVGLQSTEARERSSIFSAAADALEAYTAHGALAAASNPNFDAERFVRSGDTIYIHAPAEDQALAAPLVCGLLSEIRRATYQAHRDGALRGRVLFALDEAANIAPLQELPQIASEGGGQGLALLAALQDLSQARAHWGAQADGFLTLFGSKLILPGVADSQTLEQISLALGEYDRQIVSTTKTRQPGMWPAPGSTSRTVSTQRQRVLAPGDVANIPAGRALYLDGLSWQLLTLTPAHRTEPWRTLTQPASLPPAQAATASRRSDASC
ncbi:MAG: type IV secretory system conjugative DNA transfer family protein [Actinomycetota bacterium]|nr:type IV secretory system conjugative DNA transfer family protein [Actinomycetota bacterium]